MPQDNNKTPDVKSLISTAAQEGSPNVDAGDTAPPLDTQADGEPSEAGLAQALIQLMQADPELANKVADLIETHFSGGGQMPNQTPPVDATLLGQGGMPAGTPPVPPPTGPQAVPPQGGAVQAPPELLQRLAALEQTIAQMQRPLADYQLDRELAQARQRYEQLRQHYGDILPSDFNEMERPVLEKYNAILQGQVPPHELAVLLAAAEKLHSGDAPLRDRILAAVAQQAPAAPPVEGRGGMAPATSEKPPIAKTTAERMERLRELWRSMMQNPGV